MYRRAVVVGKFMPPHVGHQYLIDFAAQFATELFVVVDCVPGQILTVDLRVEILRRQFINKPHIHIVGIDSPTLQDPLDVGPTAKDYQTFMNTWATLLHTLVPGVDVVIGSMDYVEPLALAMQCEFLKVDTSRASIPMSATQIKADVSNWQYLMSEAKPYFVHKVAFVGPESTGKSTAAKHFATKYRTVYVPEHAADMVTRGYALSDVPKIVAVQTASEKALLPHANCFLICDSDVLTSHIWSQRVFAESPITDFGHYDMTFLFAPDTDWVEASHRQILGADDRTQMFEEFRAGLDKLGRRYQVLSGSWTEKYQKIDEYLQSVTFLDLVKNI